MAAKVESILEKSSVLSVEARKCGNQLYGQKNHNKNVHREILLWYSKSIAFAVVDEELALAYGNRSALFLHLKEYAKCLIDIDRALELTSSAELKSKLESRKAKCVDAMKSPSDNIANVSKALKNVYIKKKRQTRTEKKSSQEQKVEVTLNLPNFTPSAEIPSASEAVTVSYNEKFGRHLLATRDIKPGEVIIAERAYVCFPIIARRYLVCSHCLSFAWNGIPCDHCAFAMYCSETCKKDAWKEYHDVECSLLIETVIRPLPENDGFLHILLLALRYLIKACKSEGFDAVIGEFSNGNCKGVDGLTVEGKLRSDTFRSCINLLSLEYADEIPLYKLMIPYLMETLYHETSLFNSDGSKTDDSVKIISQLEILLKKMAGIVDCNAFRYQAAICQCDPHEPECRTTCDARRGNILAPLGSLINHSCNSNVRRMGLPNGKLVMFTIAPVKKGEQLYASYGVTYTYDEKVDRQRLLRMSFNFTCKCEACEENWPTDQEQVEIKYDESLVLMKKMAEFEECFPSAMNTSILSGLVEAWEFDEETLKHAIKLSELTYKHFNSPMIASFYNDHYKDYISEAFQRLYGEKYAVSDKCL